jgi:hypothetical protein
VASRTRLKMSDANGAGLPPSPLLPFIIIDVMSGALDPPPSEHVYTGLRVRAHESTSAPSADVAIGKSARIAL